jgi:hypothetical protein
VKSIEIKRNREPRIPKYIHSVHPSSSLSIHPITYPVHVLITKSLTALAIYALFLPLRLGSPDSVAAFLGSFFLAGAAFLVPLVPLNSAFFGLPRPFFEPAASPFSFFCFFLAGSASFLPSSFSSESLSASLSSDSSSAFWSPFSVAFLSLLFSVSSWSLFSPVFGSPLFSSLSSSSLSSLDSFLSSPFSAPLAFCSTSSSETFLTTSLPDREISTAGLPGSVLFLISFPLWLTTVASPFSTTLATSPSGCELPHCQETAGVSGVTGIGRPDDRGEDSSIHRESAPSQQDKYPKAFGYVDGVAALLSEDRRALTLVPFLDVLVSHYW